MTSVTSNGTGAAPRYAGTLYVQGCVVVVVVVVVAIMG